MFIIFTRDSYKYNFEVKERCSQWLKGSSNFLSVIANLGQYKKCSGFSTLVQCSHKREFIMFNLEICPFSPKWPSFSLRKADSVLLLVKSVKHFSVCRSPKEWNDSHFVQYSVLERVSVEIVAEFLAFPWGTQKYSKGYNL